MNQQLLYLAPQLARRCAKHGLPIGTRVEMLQTLTDKGFNPSCTQVQTDSQGFIKFIGRYGIQSGKAHRIVESGPHYGKVLIVSNGRILYLEINQVF